ncbi:cytochrome c oxidase subunit II [Bogoriella caseilytica]|nr:cytochrome c oxidase subunit II [Bogoriella caseilytica]
MGMVALLASGCVPEHLRPSVGPGNGVDVGFLPSERGLTDRTDAMIDLWTGSWIAALIVGAIVWGLTIWCIIAYRKRKNDNQLPVQLRYHVPAELLYTLLPIVMVGVLFYYSTSVTHSFNRVGDTQAQGVDAINHTVVSSEETDADLAIEVYGKQWSWDFNYLDDDVYFSGGRVQLTGEEGVEETLPTLYLPVGETVTFTLHSRDVMHSFWIPAFLYKLDMLPGRVNTFQLTPQVEGVYAGKCAELCGEYHSEMLFNVAVVDRETYDAHMQELRDAGQTGRLGDELNRQYALTQEEN